MYACHSPYLIAQQLICQLGFFRFLEAILLFFKKNEKKKVLENQKR
jgi:hypothetical protein